MSEPGSPLQRKARLPFPERAPGPPGGWGGLWSVMLAILAVGLAGLALYMWLVERHAWTSGYVIAPAIGAMWFALRLFLKFTPKA